MGRLRALTAGRSGETNQVANFKASRCVAIARDFVVKIALLITSIIPPKSNVSKTKLIAMTRSATFRARKN